MPVSVTLELDKRRAKKDGSYPIKILVVVDGAPLRISTGYSVVEKHWNSRSQSIRSSCKTYPNITRVNNHLQKERGILSDKLTQLQDQKRLQQFSLLDLKNHLTNKHREAQVLSFGAEVIAEMKQAGKVGNARVYSMVIASISNFIKGKDVPFNQVSHKWLKKYEAWYLARANKNGKPNTANGLSVNMRTLRALYNRAIKSKLVSKDSYPFTDYKITTEKTRKRAISQEDIEKLKMVVPETSRQERAKDYFFMSFYLMGASFIDLAFLRMPDIEDGRIEYKRRKTGRLHSIKITSALQALLDKYTHGKKPSDYILNIVKGDNEEQRYASARDELRRYNRSLKELAELARVTAPLTSYTARHSFATIAKYKGVPTAVISEALGHESEEVTQVYLDSFDKSVLDRYNEMIVGD